MNGYYVYVALIFLSVYALIIQVSTEKLSCDKENQGARSLKFWLKGKRNSTGDWTSDLRARSEISNLTGDFDLEVDHSIFECDGKAVVEIQGSSRGHHIAEEKILFNEKRGKKAVITNGGRTAYRENPDTEYGYGILLSSRPLVNDKIFEVRLENRLTKWGPHSVGIGVTSIPISSFTFPSWAQEIKSGIWMMYDDDFFVDSKKVKEGYGKDLGTLKAGDSMGVMRASNGELHIYVNGADQGVAATGIPENVYGVVDLIRDAVSISIV